MEGKSDEELVERYKEITDQLEKGDTEDLETQKTDIKQEYEEKVEKLKQQYEKQMKEIKQEYEEKKEEVKEECERQLSNVMEREGNLRPFECDWVGECELIRLDMSKLVNSNLG